jgi:hypothetical protein
VLHSCRLMSACFPVLPLTALTQTDGCSWITEWISGYYLTQVHKIVCDYFRKCASPNEFMLPSSQSALIHSHYSTQEMNIGKYHPLILLLGPGMVKNFPLSTPSKLALGTTQTHIQWAPGALPTGVKRPGREADHSPPTSAEITKMWIYTSTPAYVFMA